MKLAALAGQDPYGDLTPRELAWMAEARADEEWWHTASLMALVHNIVSKKPKTPEEFHPMHARAKKKKSFKESLAQMKEMLGGR